MRDLNIVEDTGETSRRLILRELRTGPKNVTEIVEATGLKQPNVSNHLARMRAKDIVRTEKLGRQVIYHLADSRIEALVLSAFSDSREGIALDTSEVALTFAKAAVNGEEDACAELMDQVLLTKMPLIDIYEDILVIAMGHVGAWCKDGTIDIAQEHLATYITERTMARAGRVTGPLRRNGRTVILGCAPNGWHVIGLRMLADYLRFCGWKALFLGANVPHQSFQTAVAQQRPDLVLLSCGADVSVEDTLKLLHALRKCPETNGIAIGVGGYCVNENEETFLSAGAQFAARSLRDFAKNYLPALERAGRPPK